MLGTGLFAPIYRRFTSLYRRFAHKQGRAEGPSPGSSLTAIREKPWNRSDVPPEIYSPKGMIGPEERRALYWLGKNWFTGRGEIVDAGAYIGASAFSIAAGLNDNP